MTNIVDFPNAIGPIAASKYPTNSLKTITSKERYLLHPITTACARNKIQMVMAAQKSKYYNIG